MRLADIIGQQIARRRALLLVSLIVIAVSGCASNSVTRQGVAGIDHRPAQPRTPHDDDDGWLQAGTDDLALAQQKLRHALRSVYQSWAGTPYEYGGQSKNGVDCSSFVRQAIDSADAFELPRTTVEQARVGMSISKNDLQTGDLVFFKTGGLSHHVGIYLGQGRFMHASASEGVTISRLDNVYWRHHYWQSRRIIADNGDNIARSSL